MTYDEVLQEWGARKIEAYHDNRRKLTPIKRGTIKVEFTYSDGYDETYGDANPYCRVFINGRDLDGYPLYAEIQGEDFDLGLTLKELFAIADEGAGE